jgi:hypothetical protein
MPIEILTSPARIVWGHPIEKQIKTDPKTKKPILDKDGKTIGVWTCGIAIPVAQFQPVEQAIAQAAYQQYPQGNFPRDFAWKIKKETDVDEQNRPYRDREGYAGHIVLTVSTQAFCPPAYKFENGQYRQLEPKEIKCGDWVVAKLLIDSHPGGVYINPVCFELVGYDKEIARRGGADPMQIFGGRHYQLPPGVSMTPVSSAPGFAPPQQAPAAPVGSYMPPAQQAVSVMPPQQAPAAPVGSYMPPPAHDFVRNAGIPAAPVAVGIPGIPQGR